MGEPMPDFQAAALAGFLAAQVMELPAKVQRRLGLPVRQDIFAESGAILRVPRRWRRPVGWLAHACTAVLIALVYALFFAVVSPQPPTIWLGLVAALIHNAIGGIVIGAYPLLHPDIPDELPAPGVSYWRWSWRDVVTFLVGHLVYGVVVTAVYRTLANGLGSTAE